VTGKLGPLDLSGAMTIRGMAQDNAAINVYAQRADTALRTGMQALALNFSGQPAELANSLDAFVSGQLEEVPEEVRADLELTAERQKLALVSEAATVFSKKQAQENSAAFQDALAARDTDLFRMAQGLPFTPEGDAALGAELDAFDAFVANSDLSPEDKGKLRRGMRTDVMSARILGQFNAQPDAASRAAYADAFTEAWTEGVGPSKDIDPAAYNSVTNAMGQAIARDQAEMARQGAALDKQADGMGERLKAGYALTPSEVSNLRSQAVMIGDEALSARADVIARLNEWQGANRMGTPAQIMAQIDALNEDMTQNGATDNKLLALNVMEGLKGQMERELTRDPLGWAQRAGVMALTPLDFSSPETTAATLNARAAEAHAVANRYGQDVRYFRPEETAALQHLAATDPDFIPSFSTAVIGALGNETPKALAEISDKAPLAAHVAGLVQSSGRTELLSEIGQVIALRQTEGYKPDLPKQSETAAIAAEVIGPALSALPQTRVAALEMADALYEGRAFTRSIPSEGFAKPDSAGSRLYTQALEEALGGETIAGVQYGGIADVNGTPTLVPPGIPKDYLENALATLNEEDLASQMPIASANGVPISVAQLRSAHLVAVSEGHYRLALNDPTSLDPQYVAAEGGGFFELNIINLMSSQTNRGATGDMTSRLKQDFTERFNSGWSF